VETLQDDNHADMQSTALLLRASASAKAPRKKIIIRGLNEEMAAHEDDY
jgi:hypothetical protein